MFIAPPRSSLPITNPSSSRIWVSVGRALINADGSEGWRVARMAQKALFAAIDRRLVNRDFAKLWYGQAISSVGDFVFTTTLTLWIAVSSARDSHGHQLRSVGCRLLPQQRSSLSGRLRGCWSIGGIADGRCCAVRRCAPYWLRFRGDLARTST